MFCYWILFISVFCYVGISALSGKGYYCRDPDTGKLYPVNSTWHSTTFCGNYTCKLRKKETINPIIPIREMVIAKILPTNAANEETMETAASTHTTSTIINTAHPKMVTEPTNKAIATSTIINNAPQNINSNNVEQGTSSNIHGDRYLTENEIKSIYQLLHNVKKSDLEAIVDIYNLAQDIYKEMDKITSQNIIDEFRAAKNVYRGEGKKSYWYEPLNRANKLGTPADMSLLDTNVYPSAIEKSTVDPNSYFQGPLTKTDFGSLPYYYPMSSFHREHSYVHDPKSNQAHLPSPSKPPCTQSTSYPYHPPTEPPKVYQHPSPAYSYYYPAQTYDAVIKPPYPVETQKPIQPSLLLPYPFEYIQHYNMSMFPYNLYYDGKPSHFDVRNNKNENSEQYFKAHTPQEIKNAVSSNTETKHHNHHHQHDKEIAENHNSKPINRPIIAELYDNTAETKSKQSKDDTETKHKNALHKNLLDTLFEQAKIEPKIRPDWQTDPLATNVLEDIKAHFEEKVKLLKPLSLRKKAKLERVGKVLKLDDLNRDKRSVDNVYGLDVDIDQEFEAYAEKTTCQSDINPGFYQMGNTTEPYPACCPRKIEDKTS